MSLSGWARRRGYPAQVPCSLSVPFLSASEAHAAGTSGIVLHVSGSKLRKKVHGSSMSKFVSSCFGALRAEAESQQDLAPYKNAAFSNAQTIEYLGRASEILGERSDELLRAWLAADESSRRVLDVAIRNAADGRAFQAQLRIGDDKQSDGMEPSLPQQLLLADFNHREGILLVQNCLLDGESVPRDPIMRRLCPAVLIRTLASVGPCRLPHPTATATTLANTACSGSTDASCSGGDATLGSARRAVLPGPTVATRTPGRGPARVTGVPGDYGCPGKSPGGPIAQYGNSDSVCGYDTGGNGPCCSTDRCQHAAEGGGRCTLLRVLEEGSHLVTVLQYPGRVLYQNNKSQEYYGDLAGQPLAEQLLRELLGHRQLPEQATTAEALTAAGASTPGHEVAVGEVVRGLAQGQDFTALVQLPASMRHLLRVPDTARPSAAGGQPPSQQPLLQPCLPPSSRACCPAHPGLEQPREQDRGWRTVASTSPQAEEQQHNSTTLRPQGPPQQSMLPGGGAGTGDGEGPEGFPLRASQTAKQQLNREILETLDRRPLTALADKLDRPQRMPAFGQHCSSSGTAAAGMTLAARTQPLACQCGVQCDGPCQPLSVPVRMMAGGGSGSETAGTGLGKAAAGKPPRCSVLSVPLGATGQGSGPDVDPPARQCGLGKAAEAAAAASIGIFVGTSDDEDQCTSGSGATTNASNVIRSERPTRQDLAGTLPARPPTLIPGTALSASLRMSSTPSVCRPSCSPPQVHPLECNDPLVNALVCTAPRCGPDTPSAHTLHRLVDAAAAVASHRRRQAPRRVVSSMLVTPASAPQLDLELGTLVVLRAKPAASITGAVRPCVGAVSGRERICAVVSDGTLLADGGERGSLEDGRGQAASSTGVLVSIDGAVRARTPTGSAGRGEGGGSGRSVIAAAHCSNTSGYSAAVATATATAAAAEPAPVAAGAAAGAAADDVLYTSDEATTYFSIQDDAVSSNGLALASQLPSGSGQQRLTEGGTQQMCQAPLLPQKQQQRWISRLAIAGEPTEWLAVATTVSAAETVVSGAMAMMSTTEAWGTLHSDTGFAVESLCSDVGCAPNGALSEGAGCVAIATAYNDVLGGGDFPLGLGAERRAGNNISTAAAIGIAHSSDPADENDWLGFLTLSGGYGSTQRSAVGAPSALHTATAATRRRSITSPQEALVSAPPTPRQSLQDTSSCGPVATAAPATAIPAIPGKPRAVASTAAALLPGGAAEDDSLRLSCTAPVGVLPATAVLLATHQQRARTTALVTSSNEDAPMCGTGRLCGGRRVGFGFTSEINCVLTTDNDSGWRQDTSGSGLTCLASGIQLQQQQQQQHQQFPQLQGGRSGSHTVLAAAGPRLWGYGGRAGRRRPPPRVDTRARVRQLLHNFSQRLEEQQELQQGQQQPPSSEHQPASLLPPEQQTCKNQVGCCACDDGDANCVDLGITADSSNLPTVLLECTSSAPRATPQGVLTNHTDQPPLSSPVPPPPSRLRWNSRLVPQSLPAASTLTDASRLAPSSPKSGPSHELAAPTPVATTGRSATADGFLQKPTRPSLEVTAAAVGTAVAKGGRRTPDSRRASSAIVVDRGSSSVEPPAARGDSQLGDGRISSIEGSMVLTTTTDRENPWDAGTQSPLAGALGRASPTEARSMTLPQSPRPPRPQQQAQQLLWHQVHIHMQQKAASPGSHTGTDAGAATAAVTPQHQPVGAPLVLVVTQVDVTEQVQDQQQTARLLQEEHKVLESIFPRHCIEYLTMRGGERCRYTAKSTHQSAKPHVRPAGGSGGGATRIAAGSRHARTAAAAGGAGTCTGAEDGTDVASGKLICLPISAGAAAAGAPAASAPAAAAAAVAALERSMTARLASLATWHPCVTVLFCDIVGFTNACHATAAFTVMAFLNDLYSRFDSLVDIYKVYKVETIGDCYMVAGGLVAYDADGYKSVISGREDPLHAVRVMEFAKAMLRVSRDVRMPHTGEPVQLRVGLHSGPVTSGVVGDRMPRFCLFGDTVNVASRMESTCRPGRIHVSAATHSRLPSEAWQDLGMTAVKGKGEMHTYVWAGDVDEPLCEHQLQRVLGLYL